MKKVSIVVPVYKAEAFLARCIDRILLLNHECFEIILIDNASPDNCGVICDEYAKKDKRIRVVHKEENVGAGAARNIGIDVANGEYVLFCDSDDAYDSKKISSLIEKLKDQPEIWNCFNYRNVWPDHVEEMMPYPRVNVRMNDTEARMCFLSSEKSHKTMGYAVWNKVYAKNIIDQYHVRFPERDTMGNKDDWAEDLSFNLQYGMCISGVHVDEIAAYLLSKHGTPEQQSENGLIGRIDHMLNIMVHLMKTQAYQQNETCRKEFWKIVIWHMKRYFYLEAGAKGMQGLRETCIHSPHWDALKGWIVSALSEWKQYGQRWNTRDAMDYKNMLNYLISGNMLKYRIQSYYLWKIRPLIQL